MLGNLSGWHLIIILFIILLLWGAPKLPGLAKSLGQSAKILKKEVRETVDDDSPAAPQQTVNPNNTVSPQNIATGAQPQQAPPNVAQQNAQSAAQQQPVQDPTAQNNGQQ